MFRVTNNTLFRNTLRDIQSTAAAFARAQQQVSSGKRLQQASDDPSAATVGMRERAEIRAADRYREANDAVDSRLRVTDTVLSDIISTITTAQTRAAAGRSTVLTAQQREAVALEIEGAKQAIFTAINTSYRGMYLFAGADTTAEPYTRVGATVSAYQGDATVVSVDVSRTSTAEVTVNGGAVLQGSAPADLFQTLDALATAIRAGNMTGIDGGLTELEQAFDRVTAAQSRVGATLGALPAEKARLDELRRASDTRRSQAEEINLAEAISDMSRAQQAQQAAIAAAGTSQRSSLMDYLR
jgi:flagellar hook-associated protein 3 FlgL